MLAGGLGTRLRSVVSDCPKPMAAVGSKPFLEHLMSAWARNGIQRFILCVGYQYEKIQSYFGNQFQGIPVEYSIERRPLGTGGALAMMQRQHKLQQRFILLNGDTFFLSDIVALGTQASTLDADWTFSLFLTDDSSRFMRVPMDETGIVRLNKAREDISSPFYANGGVYAVHPRAIAPFLTHSGKLSLEDDMFPQACALNQVLSGVVSTELFIDIGLPADYQRAQHLSIFNSKGEDHD